MNTDNSAYVILSVLAKDLASELDARSFASTLRMTCFFGLFSYLCESVFICGEIVFASYALRYNFVIENSR